MPPTRNWWIFHHRLIDLERPTPGVYELADKHKEVLYIGSAQNMFERLLQHLVEQARDERFKDVTCFRVQYVDNCEGAAQRLLSEYSAAHGGRLPRCNQSSA